MAQRLTHEHLELFANRRRAEIIEILLEGEISVGALSRRLDLGQSALSQHLAKMRAAGVVDTRRDRQTIFYSSNFEPARRLLDLLESNHG